MADLIKVLRYDEEAEEAEIEQILQNPQKDYTKSLCSVRKLHKDEVPSDETVLLIEGVNASCAKVKVPRARTVAVVGKSGSGKSTTARVITGLLPPSAGKIMFDGEELSADLKNRSKDQLQRIQMIYQMTDTAMNPKQSVAEIIGRPLEFYHNLRGKQKQQEILQLLEMIKLNERFYDQFPDELLGGQKQRVCIARALAAKPEFIICDEVTSALDQIVQEGMLKLLVRLQKELEITYIFITHDINVVKAISDEIVVMKEGRVVEQGLKSKVMSPPIPRLYEVVTRFDPLNGP